jgi:hypothetical protein
MKMKKTTFFFVKSFIKMNQFFFYISNVIRLLLKINEVKSSKNELYFHFIIYLFF